MSTDQTSGSSSSKPSTRSVNDQKLIDYLTQKFTTMERELKETKDALADLQSRPSPATERELFLLAELDKVNLQLECEYTRVEVLSLPSLLTKCHCVMLAQVHASTNRKRKLGCENVWMIRPIDRSIRPTLFGQIGQEVECLSNFRTALGAWPLCSRPAGWLCLECIGRYFP